STAVNTPFATALQARVTDAAANPVANVTVTFTAPSTGASASFAGNTTTTAVTNAAGIATSSIPTANAVAGVYNITASAAALTPANFPLINPAGTPQTLPVSTGTPQSTVVNTPFAAALQALVTDAASNPVANVVVTFTAPATGASAAFDG